MLEILYHLFLDIAQESRWRYLRIGSMAEVGLKLIGIECKTILNETLASLSRLWFRPLNLHSHSRLLVIKESTYVVDSVVIDCKMDAFCNKHQSKLRIK